MFLLRREQEVVVQGGGHRLEKSPNRETSYLWTYPSNQIARGGSWESTFLHHATEQPWKCSTSYTDCFAAGILLWEWYSHYSGTYFSFGMTAKKNVVVFLVLFSNRLGCFSVWNWAWISRYSVTELDFMLSRLLSPSAECINSNIVHSFFFWGGGGGKMILVCTRACILQPAGAKGRVLILLISLVGKLLIVVAVFCFRIRGRI